MTAASSYPPNLSVPAQPLERLTGVVERVTFHNPHSGFCVLRVQVRGQRELVTLVGTVAQIAPGESVEAARNRRPWG